MKLLWEKYKSLPVAVKASGWYMLCNIIQNGLGFITLPIFTRILTTEEYGLYSIYLTWMNIIVIFTTLNLQYGVFNTAMLKFEKERDRFISSMQGLTTVITIGWFILYITLRNLWNSLFHLPTILMVAMILEMWLLPAKDYWCGKQRFEYKYKGMVLYTLALTFLNPLICILAITQGTGDGGITRVLAATAVNVVFYLVIYVYNFKKGKVFYNKTYWTYAVQFGVPLIAYYLSQMIFNQSDKIMIEHMAGRDKAGIYALIYSCSTIVVFVLNSINSAFVPWKYQKMQEKSYREIDKVSNWLALFIVGILMAVIMCGPEIVKIISTPEYYEAIWIMPPVVGSLFFLFLSQLFIDIEFYYEEKKYLVLGSIMSAVLNVVLNFFAIKQWGYIAAGYTTLIAYIVFAISNYYYMAKICKKRLGGQCIYNPVILLVFSIGFLVCILGSTLIYPYPLLRWGILLGILLIAVINYKKILGLVQKFKSGK